MRKECGQTVVTWLHWFCPAQPRIWNAHALRTLDTCLAFLSMKVLGDGTREIEQVGATCVRFALA